MRLGIERRYRHTILLTQLFVVKIKYILLFRMSFEKVRDCYGRTSSGFMRISAPLWARGQDAYLVIRGTRVQAPSAIYMVYLLKATQSLHLVTPT